MPEQQKKQNQGNKQETKITRKPTQQFTQMKKDQELIQKEIEQLKKQKEQCYTEIDILINKKNDRPIFDKETFQQIHNLVQKQKEMKMRVQQIREEMKEMKGKEDTKQLKYQSVEQVKQEIDKLEEQLASSTTEEEQKITNKIQELTKIKMQILSSQKHKNTQEQKFVQLEKEQADLKKTIRANTKVLDELFVKQEKLDAKYQQDMKNIDIAGIDEKIKNLKAKITEINAQIDDKFKQKDQVYQEFKQKEDERYKLKNALDKLYQAHFKITKKDDEYEVIKPKLYQDRDKARRDEFIEVLKKMEQEVAQEEKKVDNDVVETHLHEDAQEPIFDEFEVSKESMKNKEARDKKIEELQKMDRTEEYKQKYEERCAELVKLVDEYKALGGKITIIE